MDWIKKYFSALVKLGIVALLFVMLAIIASIYIFITWGALLLFFVAYKKYRQNRSFKYWLLAAFACVISAYFVVTLDSIRDSPLIFGFGIIGITVSTLFSSFVIILLYYKLKERRVFNSYQFASIAVFTVIVLAIILYKFEARYESYKLLFSNSNQYKYIIIEEKRRRYGKEFIAFRNSHSRFNLKDYINFSKYIDNNKRYIKDPRDYYLEDIDSSYSGDLIIFHLGSTIQELNFKLTRNHYGDYISRYCLNSFIVGYDVSYLNGEIQGHSVHDGVPFINYCDEQTQYALRNSEPVFKQILIRAFVIEDNIDEYIKYVENIEDHNYQQIKEMFILDKYLKIKDIPFDFYEEKPY